MQLQKISTKYTIKLNKNKHDEDVYSFSHSKSSEAQFSLHVVLFTND